MPHTLCANSLFVVDVNEGHCSVIQSLGPSDVDPVDR